MRLLDPDGTPLADEPSPGPGKPVWRVPREKLCLIDVEGPGPALLETPDAQVVLEPGGDYVIVAKERYLRMATELSLFKDYEKRALASLTRRVKHRRERDLRP